MATHIRGFDVQNSFYSVFNIFYFAFTVSIFQSYTVAKREKPHEKLDTI